MNLVNANQLDRKSGVGPEARRQPSPEGPGSDLRCAFAFSQRPVVLLSSPGGEFFRSHRGLYFYSLRACSQALAYFQLT
jgi:hypothetical protein